MWVDTHCHIYFEDYDKDRQQVIDQARLAQVEAMVVLGIDTESNLAAYNLASLHKNIFSCAGLHPHSAHLVEEGWDQAFKNWLRDHDQTIGVGEVGLDFYKSEADRHIQIEVFEQAARIAREFQLPLVIHSRNAYPETVEVLQKVFSNSKKERVLFHCFTYGPKELEQIIQNAWSISLSGIVTFPNAKELKEVARLVPLENLMIETDSPYLTPQPHRGERNEPAYVRHVGEEIARIKNIPLEKIAHHTTQNAKHFFGIKT